MMVDTEAKKILKGPWADSGDRENPEDVGISRGAGWTVPYEQINSGLEPERTIFNQRGREIDGWAIERMRTGIPGWDGDIDYQQDAFVTSSGNMYIALVANGPVLGNTVNPAESGQSVWRIY